MPSISSSSWNVSGAHLRVMRGNRPSERTMPVKILPRTLKQRSSPHGMSSVTSGKERQSLRIHSTSGMGKMIACGYTPSTSKCTRARVPAPHELHLVSGFAQHYRHLHLFLASEDSDLHGVAGAVF